MSQEIVRQPLDVSLFPANLQKHVDPAAPPPLKMMAARGMVPAPPDQMLRLLYQLHFDAAVAGDVVKALEAMPDNVLVPAVQAEQPAEVLDWVAAHRTGAALEAVLLNRHTDDRTVARLAASADDALCEIIATNQVRVLRHPAIIAALYGNINARMSTVDKLVDLARRNGVELSELPGLEHAVAAPQAPGDQAGIDDDAFAKLLQAEAARIQDEDARASRLEKENLTRAERERLQKQLDEEEEQPQQRKGGGALHSQIAEMSIAQKIRLATVGSKEAIGLLLRDTNKLVHMAAVRSPRLQAGDIRKLAGNKSLPEGVIKYIASNKDWTRHYEVMVALVNNPKTPLSDTLSFMNHLRTRELRDLSKNRNVPQQVARQARTLANKRSGG